MLGVLIGMLPTTAFATYNVSADPRDNADLWKVALQKGSTTHSVPLYASDSTVEYRKDQWAGNNHLQGVAVDDDMRYLYVGQQCELDEATWDKVMNVNLKGLFFCAQSAARVLVRQRHGVIVNMSSESGLEGSEGQSVYAASKNAVNSLTRSWAKELGKKGVRVVGVAPGILEATGLRTLSYETALAYTRGITVEQLRAGYAKTSTTPMGRSGKLSEVASVVAFMLSGRAGYVDGVTLNIAGGKTRG